MGWSTNERAEEKREKEKQKKNNKNQERAEKIEEKKWKDTETEKKIQNNKEKEEKRQRQLARKKQLKELVQKQEQEMEKINKKKEIFTEKKLTQAQIAANILKREMQKLKLKEEQNNIQNQIQEKNINKEVPQYEVAQTVEEALQILGQVIDKHPQKRIKAAFQLFCQRRQSELKAQFPKLKRSKRIQMMHKEFQKSPDNPFNKNIVAYNYKKKKDEDQNDE